MNFSCVVSLGLSTGADARENTGWTQIMLFLGMLVLHHCDKISEKTREEGFIFIHGVRSFSPRSAVSVALVLR
jgi:hypothetical protein